jgi:chromosomal replication initiation ATPase DnaA
MDFVKLPDFLENTIRLHEAQQKAFGKSSLPHQVLVGPPGCGKSAFAQAYGKALHERGIAAAAPVVIEAHMFRFVGEAAKAFADITAGATIVVDEADKLAGNPSFSGEIVSCLLNAIENKKCTVVLVGYAEGIHQLLKSDPGLERRLPPPIDVTNPTPAPPAKQHGWDTDMTLQNKIKPLARIRLTPP